MIARIELYISTGRVTIRASTSSRLTMNSFSARMNISRPPVITPGMTAGRVTVKNVASGGAPQLAAAFSSSGSRLFTEAATAQIMNGRLMMQAARPTGQSWPSQRSQPKISIRPRPETISGTMNGSSR